MYAVVVVFVALAFVVLFSALAVAPILASISLIILTFEVVKTWQKLQSDISEKELNQALALLCLSAIVALLLFPGAVAEAMKIGTELLLLLFGLTWFT